MKSICHYTSANKAIKILSSQIFKFGQFVNSNDPFENLSKRYILTYSIREPLKSYMDKIFEYANSEISLASFGIRKKLIPPDQNWPMWAHYGEKHSGVCLTFDLTKMIQEIKKQTDQVISHKITYTNSLIIPPNYFEDRLSKTEREILTDFQKNLIFSKHTGWESENEFRIVVFQKSLEIPIKNCLKQVLFGPEIKKRNQSRLENILRLSDFQGPYGKLGYAAGSYAKPLKFIFQDIKPIKK